MFETFPLRRAAVRILDLLYPPICAVCEAVLSEGRALCAACDDGLPRLETPFCARCGEHFEGRIDGDFVCPNCAGLSYWFEFARPALVVNDKTRELVHRLKYGREVHLAADLGKLAAEAFADERLAIALEEKWPLVPVPLHRSRLEFRHFNQALEIARPLALRTGLPVLQALKRVRKTVTQTRLTRNERLENLRGAFAISNSGKNWPNRRGAVIVDDVFTTGSTVDACAAELRRAGFQRIFVVTVMRG